MAAWFADRERTLLAGAALLLALAVADPVVRLEQSRFHHVVVLDVTQSMDVPDMVLDGRPVSRLTLSRQSLAQALLALPCGSKVGLGLFTEYRSFLLLAPVEVCTHLVELRGTLEGIDGRLAWTGNSEVAKGLHAGLRIARELPEKPTLVFVTDGHEAPPVNPRHRPRFDGEPGQVRGWVVGVGELNPSPIPKSDSAGRPLGYWGADEVLQTDTYSRGRGGSVAGEQMVELDPTPPVVPLGATPGSEHLSGLRESYLQRLADETGLGYVRLSGPQTLVKALSDPALARPLEGSLPLKPGLASVALLFILWRYAPRWRQKKSR